MALLPVATEHEVALPAVGPRPLLLDLAPERGRGPVGADELVHRAVDHRLGRLLQQIGGAVVDQPHPAGRVQRHHACPDRRQDRLHPGLLALERALAPIQPLAHGVERALELAELVLAAGRRQPVAEMPGGDLARAALERGHGPRHRAREPPAHDEHEADRERRQQEYPFSQPLQVDPHPIFADQERRGERVPRRRLCPVERAVRHEEGAISQ